MNSDGKYGANSDSKYGANSNSKYGVNIDSKYGENSNTVLGCLQRPTSVATKNSDISRRAL